jgi:hypothetical protein
MKHAKYSNLTQFELSQLGLNSFRGIASPAEVRPNLYGVD